MALYLFHKIVLYTFLQLFLHSVLTECCMSLIHPDLLERESVELVTDIIVQDGYPVEEHFVTTKDGYILGMHRIFNQKRARSYWGRRKVVLLMHCLFCSSANYVLSGPSEALAYLLYDNGFDVWLGNFRGNIYSRQHVWLDPEENEFWEFTWDQMARYDLPALIDYVLEQSSSQSLFYIGHSMGTTAFFGMMNLFPLYNEKPLYEMVNTGEISERSSLRNTFVDSVCAEFSPLHPLCNSILPIYNGINDILYDEAGLTRILSHYPAGNSIRNAAHFGQMISTGRFQMFDLGFSENFKTYGRMHPPTYTLQATRIPVAVFWAENDWTTDPQDIQEVVEDIPNLILNYRIPESRFNHIDVLLAKNARNLIYKPILNILRRF